MDEQAQKDAEASFKNAKGGWSGMQGYAYYKGKKLGADAYVAAVKADLLSERRKLGGAGGTPTPAAPMFKAGDRREKDGFTWERDDKGRWSKVGKASGLETRIVPSE
jgi:hypothetical protein